MNHDVAAITARPAVRDKEELKIYCAQLIHSFPEKLLAPKEKKAEATRSCSVREGNARCLLQIPSAVLPQWLRNGSACFLLPSDPKEATICLAFK